MALFIKLNGSVFSNKGLPRIGALKTAPIALADDAAYLHYILGAGLSLDNMAGTGGTSLDRGVIQLNNGIRVNEPSHLNTQAALPSGEYTILIAVTGCDTENEVAALSSDNLSNGASITINPTAKKINCNLRNEFGSVELNYSSLGTLPISIISFRCKGTERDVQIINKALKATSSVPSAINSSASIRLGSVPNQFTFPGWVTLAEAAIFDVYLTDTELTKKYTEMKARLASRGIVVAV